jgi:hypothetical protein
LHVWCEADYLEAELPPSMTIYKLKMSYIIDKYCLLTGKVHLVYFFLTFELSFVGIVLVLCVSSCLKESEKGISIRKNNE